MRAFRVVVGKFEIVATLGSANGYLPAGKADAVGYDVIERNNGAAGAYVSRDVEFEAAFDYCTRRCMVQVLH